MDAQTEAANRVASGARQLTVNQFKAEFAALGYRFDADMACKSLARYMTGPYAGETYPANSWYPVQADDGLSAWNVNARRDDNFKALQKLRNEVFAVYAGYVIEV
jgi:hypothetical protein